MNNSITSSSLDELHGTLDRFVYQNTQTGFAVGLLQVEKKDPITITGIIATVNPGQLISLKGTWIVHPKFGKQFEVHQCTAHLPTSILGLTKYLGSGLIKGIGPAYAKRLVDRFGTNVLEVMDKQPHRLHEVSGLGTKRIDRIIEGWQHQKDISHIMVFLQEKGISPAYANKIYKQYGADSVSVITENPYRLAHEVWGIGFKMADQIALSMGFEKDSLKRVTAGILYCLSTLAQEGHLYCIVTQLKEKTSTLLEIDQAIGQEKCKLALHALYEQSKIKLITHNQEHYIGLSQHYFAEKNTAQKILLLHAHAPLEAFNLDTIYTHLRAPKNANALHLHDNQQQAIMSCLQHKVSVITGGPGTGKTTIIKTLITILEQSKIAYKLAAPTGRAAKRMTESTQRPALTIHRLLEFDVNIMGFARNEQNALTVQFLIIDEASMIDIFLANALLKAVPYHAHILFIGDTDQLPAVGAGNFLNDLIKSNIAKTTHLTEIFRQSQNSLIVTNAHRVNRGEFPVQEMPDARKDFIFIKEDDPSLASQHLEHTLSNGLRRMQIAQQDAMILVPMNRGTIGTAALNQQLQAFFNNAPQKQFAHGGTLFKVNDRVMQIKNNYDKLVFNGDIGFIKDIDLDDGTVLVAYPEREVVYETNELDELTLAYATTIHKSQGSEYAAVIILLFTQHFTLLQRNLIYTAITRAKKLCIIIGQTKAIAMALNNNKAVQRTTFLQQFLTTDLQCR